MEPAPSATPSETNPGNVILSTATPLRGAYIQKDTISKSLSF